MCGYFFLLFAVGFVGLLAALAGGALGCATRSTRIGAATAFILAVALNVGLFAGLYLTTPTNAPPSVRRTLTFDLCQIADLA